MAIATITRVLVAAAVVGGFVSGFSVAVVATTATVEHNTHDSTASPGRTRPPTADGEVGAAEPLRAAGAGALPIVSAYGVSVAGPMEFSAEPLAVTVDGIHIASEPEVRVRADVVTAMGVTVSASHVGDHYSAVATIEQATYKHHDLGPITIRCTDGVVTPGRADTVHLSNNTTVTYGQVRDGRGVGATVLVRGPKDRVLHMVTIASVACPPQSLHRLSRAPAAPTASPHRSSPRRSSLHRSVRHRPATRSDSTPAGSAQPAVTG